MSTAVATSEAVIDAIVARALSDRPSDAATLDTAALCLLDAMGCALGALATGEPNYLLGPHMPGASAPRGARVPGTGLVLDPVKAAFDISVLVRWLDLSDTSPVGGHPSDNIGALLAAADGVSRSRGAERPPVLMRDVLEAMTSAYEIHGALAEANRFDRPAIGLDHVIYVKIASAALACRLMGGREDQVRSAVSHAWLDGHALNACRHMPNAGPRKGWAGGDAASRGVWLAGLALRGEPAAPRPLSAPVWGFEEVYLGGEPVRLDRELGAFFMDSIIFKMVPAQRNGSTAVEAAIRLSPWYRANREKIAEIRIATHDEAMRRIVKDGPLPNREARDHCLQYMVAIGFMKGRLALEDYSDAAAADPEVDRLRALMTVTEDAGYTADHHDMSKRTCANAIEIVTRDGDSSGRMEVLYPVGDVARRDEALPMLREKFLSMTEHSWNRGRQERVLALFADAGRLAGTPVPEVMALVSEREDR